MFWQTQTVCGISYTLLKIIIIVHRQNVHTWTSQFVPLQNVYMTSNYFPYDMYRVTCILDFIHTRQARRQEFPEGVTLRVTHLAESKFWTLNKTSFLIVLICFKGRGGVRTNPSVPLPDYGYAHVFTYSTGISSLFLCLFRPQTGCLWRPYINPMDPVNHSFRWSGGSVRPCLWFLRSDVMMLAWLSVSMPRR